MKVTQVVNIDKDFRQESQRKHILQWMLCVYLVLFYHIHADQVLLCTHFPLNYLETCLRNINFVFSWEDSNDKTQ